MTKPAPTSDEFVATITRALKRTAKEVCRVTKMHGTKCG